MKGFLFDRTYYMAKCADCDSPTNSAVKIDDKWICEDCQSMRQKQADCHHLWVRRRDGSWCANCGLPRFGQDLSEEERARSKCLHLWNESIDDSTICRNCGQVFETDRKAEERDHADLP